MDEKAYRPERLTSWSQLFRARNGTSHDGRLIAIPTVTIEETRAHFGELIEHVQPGEEIFITDRGQPLAQVQKRVRRAVQT